MHRVLEKLGPWGGTWWTHTNTKAVSGTNGQGNEAVDTARAHPLAKTRSRFSMRNRHRMKMDMLPMVASTVCNPASPNGAEPHPKRLFWRQSTVAVQLFTPEERNSISSAMPVTTNKTSITRRHKRRIWVFLWCRTCTICSVIHSPIARNIEPVVTRLGSCLLYLSWADIGLCVCNGDIVRRSSNV